MTSTTALLYSDSTVTQEDMMYTALDKAVLFHEQQCTFSACVGHDARAELAAFRQRVAELERERDEARARVAELEAAQDNQADSLRHWSDLWTHINKRLGYADGDLLPNASNFDYLIRDNWLIQSTEPTLFDGLDDYESAKQEILETRRLAYPISDGVEDRDE